jgi:hypothetical protein
MEFHRPIKKSQLVLFAGKWMELELFTLSEISQPHKVFSHLWKPGGKQNFYWGGRRRREIGTRKSSYGVNTISAHHKCVWKCHGETLLCTI